MSSTVHNLLMERNSPEYLNIIAVGDAFIILSDGLRTYAANKMKEFHSKLLSKLGGVKCSCSCTPGMKQNPHNNAKKSTCMWAKELRNFHCNNHIPWRQSDSKKWHDPTDGYWEVAKVFMSNLGGRSNDVKDPNSTDLTCLLNLMIYCKHFNVRQDLLESVKDWRNKLAHATKVQVSEADKQSAFQALTNLMNDAELMSCMEVQQCRSTIEEVRLADDISILQENEFRVLEELRRLKEYEAKDRELKIWEENKYVPVSNVPEVDEPPSRKIFTFLSFFMFLVKKGSRLLSWWFLLFGLLSLLVSKVGDKLDVELDNGCSHYFKESPISRFPDFQEFDFLSYLAYKRAHFFGRKWFFMELEEIFEIGRSPPGVLITGEPGSGKTALMSQLICSPYSSLFIHNNIIGYHLCDYSEKGKRNGARFVRNLVDQIAASISEYSDHVANNEQLRRVLDERCESDPTGCFYSAIVGPLRELKNQPDSLRYILIDALDECLEEDLKTSEILDIINSKILYFPKWLKIILTSRNLTVVTTKIPRTVKRLPLDPTDERNVEDIRSYIKHFLSQNSFFVDRLLQAMSSKSTTEGIDHLISELTKSGEGNFLFVKKTLEYMDESDGRVNLQSFPTSLYDMYKGYFKRYFGEHHEFLRFKALFEILLASGSPLDCNEIGSILKLQNQTEEVSKLLQQVSFFMRYGPDGTVRIYHHSFAEWLVNQTDDLDGFSISKKEGHRYIADFLLYGIRNRNTNLTFEELSQLSMHVLSGGTLESHKQALALLNVSEIREPHYDRCILHDLAMEDGSFPLLKIFLPKFVSADIPDMEGKTPAFYAASKGIVENLKLFMDRGADVNYVHADHLPSLDLNHVIMTLGRNSGVEDISMMYIAVHNGHINIVELLIKSKMSYTQPRRNMPTPLHLAAANGDLEIVKLLYNSGAKADIISLHHAAARNHSAVVQFLLKTAGVIDECLLCKSGKILDFSQDITVEEFHTSFCETALHAAVSRRYIGIVKLLLTFGKTSLECKHHSGKTPLMDAVERNDTEMVELLLNAGANVEGECGDEILRDSIEKMCAGLFPYKYGFLYTVYCEKDFCTCGSKAVHLCGRYGLWEMALHLTQKWNADVFGNNCDANSAVFIAIHFDHDDFIYHVNRILNLNDEKVVFLAAFCGSTKTLKLFSGNPDIFTLLPTIRVMTPVSAAVFFSPVPLTTRFRSCSQVLKIDSDSLQEKINNESKKRIAAVKLMAESQKNVSFFLNIKDEGGKTALHYAVMTGFADAVKYLIEHGSNVSAEDLEGKTPLKLALDSSPMYPHAFTRCYNTIDDVFTACNTTSYDVTLSHLIFAQKSNIKICDSESSRLLGIVIGKRMPLSLYSLMKIGVDINCKLDEIASPFLSHLNRGGKQISEVFKIFEIDISVECGVPFRLSELHLLAYSSRTGSVGNFFMPSVNNRSFPLQRLIKNHPKGYRIFDECRDAEGYLAIHRAAQGGNLDAIKWLISIGVDILQKTSSGLTALDLSIFYLGSVSRAKTFSTLGKPSFPLTNNMYRRLDTFEKLLEFFTTAKHDRSTFKCDSTFEGFSPLHIAALRGVKMLQLVYKKAVNILSGLPLNCTNKHWIRPCYLAYFHESLEDMRNISSKPQNTSWCLSDGANLQYPDREAEYHIIYNYFYNNSRANPMLTTLYQNSLNLYPITVTKCPGFYELLPKRETLDTRVSCRHFFESDNEETNNGDTNNGDTNNGDTNNEEINNRETNNEEIDNVETNLELLFIVEPPIQSLAIFQSQEAGCRVRIDPQRSPFDKFYHDCYCAVIMQHLQGWLTGQPKENRQVSQFIAERMGWKDTSADGDVRDRWPFYFLYKKAMNEYESYKYIETLNKALELNDSEYYNITTMTMM